MASREKCHKVDTFCFLKKGVTGMEWLVGIVAIIGTFSMVLLVMMVGIRTSHSIEHDEVFDQTDWDEHLLHMPRPTRFEQENK